MANKMYVVEGVDARFVKYQIYTDNEIVRLICTTRAFDVPYEEMPEFLRSWIPLTEDGIGYDHISAELGVTPLVDNPNLLPAEQQNENINEITPEDRLQSMFLALMEHEASDTQSIQETLKQAILNLKDLRAGPGGGSYINQAKGIANLVHEMLINKKLTIERYQLAMKLFGLDKKGPKSTSEKKGGD